MKQVEVRGSVGGRVLIAAETIKQQRLFCMEHILSMFIVVDDWIELCSPDRIGVFFVDFIDSLEVGAAVEILVGENDAFMGLEGNIVVLAFSWFCLVLELKLLGLDLLLHLFLLCVNAIIDGLASHDYLHAGLPGKFKLVHLFAIHKVDLLRLFLAWLPLLLFLLLLLLSDDALQRLHHVVGHLVEVGDHLEA